MIFFASAQLLHIPDGFLSLPVAVAGWLLACAALSLALRKAQAQFDERLAPLAGVMAAFIFAAQMINFPVAGGTSGHLLGAALAAIVLGPWLGIVVMAAVIALQALLFQDGGLLVMGANIVVMGVVPALVGYGLYRTVAGRGRRLKVATTTVAAWLSVLGAALATALLLGLSGTASFRLVVPALLGIHALIGVGEALLTAAALRLIGKSRPALLRRSATAGGRASIGAGLALTLATIFLAPFASRLPDGLTWVAARQAFLGAAEAAPYQLLAGYRIPALGESALSTVLAGAAGALVAAGVATLLARALRRLRPRSERAETRHAEP